MNWICLWDLSLSWAPAENSVGTSLEVASFGTCPYAKHSRASAFCFFSVHNHGIRTHFPRKNTRAYRNSVTRVTRVNIESSRSTYRLNSQHLAAVPTSNTAELVPFGFCCPQPWFLWLFHFSPGWNFLLSLNRQLFMRGICLESRARVSTPIAGWNLPCNRPLRLVTPTT